MPLEQEQDDTKRDKYGKLLYQAPGLVQEMIDSITGRRRGSYEDSLGAYNAAVAQHGLDQAISDTYRQGWQGEQDAYQKFQNENRIPLAEKLMEAVEGRAPGFNFDASYNKGDDAPGRVVLRTGGYLPDYRLSNPREQHTPYEAGYYKYDQTDPPPIGQPAWYRPYEGYNVKQAELLGNALTTYGNPNSNKSPYYWDLQNPWADTPGTGYNPEDPRMQSPEFNFDTSGQASGESFTTDPLWGRLEQSGAAIHKLASRADAGSTDRLMGLKAAAYGLSGLADMENAGSTALSDQQAATQAQLDTQAQKQAYYDAQYGTYQSSLGDFRNAQSAQTFYDRAIDEFVRNSRSLYDQNKNKPLGTPGTTSGNFGGTETRQRLDAPGTSRNPGNSVAASIADSMYRNRQLALSNLFGTGGVHPQSSLDLAALRPAGKPLPSAPGVPTFDAAFVETQAPSFDTKAGDYARKLQNIQRINNIR